MMPNDPYNQLVRDCFSDPQHAGDLTNEYQITSAATVAESVAGDRLTVTVGIDDGLIVAARFRADACPHLIAAAELACTDLENQTIGGLRDFDSHKIMRRLSVPPEKIGKILVLEDVLTTLAQQIEQSIQE
ncbi:MAG: iron-sulfur cluster assembly scaffold protein [Woeseiaceae bacterium]|mgnify:FL=1|jgi:NifU-like protein involved in Fe-S cluster formation|nr:iron-sulfur cluster assembly scaffold protein [Woeseiaceae bacterium]